MLTISIILISSFSAIGTDVIFSRYNNLLSLMITGNYHDDPSTAVRIAEIKNVLNELIIHLPYSF